MKTGIIIVDRTFLWKQLCIFLLISICIDNLFIMIGVIYSRLYPCKTTVHVRHIVLTCESILKKVKNSFSIPIICINYVVYNPEDVSWYDNGNRSTLIQYNILNGSLLLIL